MGTPASTLSLVIQQQTTGSQDVNKLEQGLQRVGDAASRVGRETADLTRRTADHASNLAKEAVSLYAVEKAYNLVRDAVVGTTAAYVTHHTAAELVVNSYRAIRLALSPTIFTATQVAVGALAIESLRAADSTSKLVEQQAFSAAKAKISFQEIQQLTAISKIYGEATEDVTSAVSKLNSRLADSNTGDDVRNVLSSIGVSVEDSLRRSKNGTEILADIGREFDKITDPVERAQKAVEIFGADAAEKVLPHLNSSIRDNIDTVTRWGGILDKEDRENLAKFKASLDGVRQVFVELGQDTRTAGIIVETTLARIGAAMLNTLSIRNNPGFKEGITGGGKVGQENAERALRDSKTSIIPSDEQFTSDAVAALGEQVQRIGGTFAGPLRLKQSGLSADAVKSATQLLENTDKTREGLERQLSEAQAKAVALRKNLADAESLKDSDVLQAQIATRVIQTQGKIKQLQNAIDGIDAAEKRRDEARKTAEERERGLLDLQREADIASLTGLDRKIAEYGQLNQQVGFTGDQLKKAQEAELKIVDAEAVAQTAKLREEFDRLAGTITRIASLSTINAGGFTLPFVAIARDAKEANPEIEAGLRKQGEIASQNIEAQKRFFDLRTQSERDDLNRQAQKAQKIAELSTNPGFEEVGVERAFNIRLNLAKQIFDVEQKRADVETNTAKQSELRAKAQFELDRQLSEAQIEREVKLAELKRKDIDSIREAAGHVFDSLQSNGATGFVDFITGQLKVVERTIFQNLSVEFLKNATGKLSLPGQGTAENPNFLGRILAGTPLGIDPGKAATDLNTAATVANTAALQATTAQALGGSVGGGAGSALGPLFGGSQGGGIFNLASGTSANGLPQIQTFPTPVIPGLDTAASSTNPGLFSRANLGKDIGIAGAAAGGVFGAVSGFGRGGASGVLSGAGSLAGSAGAILGLAGLSGPAAPILAGVGLALGVFSSFFGQNKQKRDTEITNELESNRYRPNTSLDLSFDSGSGGNLFDYDSKGRLRGSQFSNFPVNVREPSRYQNADGSYTDLPGQQYAPFDSRANSSPPPQINVNISTMDSKSFMDNMDKIAPAVQGIIANHQPTQDEIRRQTVNR